MTKQELLKSAKPILFNTEMVRAILDGRKTETRRCVRRLELEIDVDGSIIGVNDRFEGRTLPMMNYAPYRHGDALYIRETWQKHADGKQYLYLADYSNKEYATACLGSAFKWHPSIHMPKDAARIFLRVADVSVERLQDITEEGAKAEGSNYKNGKNIGWEEKMRRTAIDRFAELWNSTVKDLDKYGWVANPWVWVIELERIEIEE